MIKETETLAIVFDFLYIAFKNVRFDILTTEDCNYYWMNGSKDYKVIVKLDYERIITIDIKAFNNVRIYIYEDDSKPLINEKIFTAVNKLNFMENIC